MIYDYNNYYRDYYNKNKIKYFRSNKKYISKIKRHCIYKLIDKNRNVLYIGSTDNIYTRLSQHITKNSHLLVNNKGWEKLNCHFEYAHVDAVTQIERLYIEHYLINKYMGKGIWNHRECYVETEKDFKITDTRKVELDSIADNLPWINFNK